MEIFLGGGGRGLPSSRDTRGQRPFQARFLFKAVNFLLFLGGFLRSFIIFLFARCCAFKRL